MKKIFLLSTLYSLLAPLEIPLRYKRNFHNLRPKLWVIFLTGLATFISCSPTPQRPQVVSLSIFPSSAELAVGEEKAFTVSAKDKQGNIVSVVAKWSVQGDIGEISKQGLFKATAEGEGVVKVLADFLVANSLVIVKEKEKFEPFFVYTEWTSKNDHFIPSGWMGDHGDIALDENWLENPHSGETCIKITYTAKATQGNRWAGIYWQEPANNWGTIDAGFDLNEATKLTFWARGEKGGERIAEFKLGGIRNKYSDSTVAGIGPVALTQDWEKYEIDLSDKDLSYIIGGFCWSTNQTNNPDGCTFYLDDIKYE